MTNPAREEEARRVLKGGLRESSRVSVGDVVVGGPEFVAVAGPCAVEGEAMARETALAVSAARARPLRGGVFKPRTSPYSCQGLGSSGLDALAAAGAEAGLPL